MKTIQEIILHCKAEYHNDNNTEEEKDNYLLVGKSLVELLAYQEMYKDDWIRMNKYSEEVEKTIEELKEEEQ